MKTVILLFVASAMPWHGIARAENVRIRITVGGTRVTHETCTGELTEFSRETEEVEVAVDRATHSFRDATRFARQVAQEKELKREAFVKMAADKICCPPKIVEVKVPVDRPVFVDRPVIVDRPVYVDRPVVMERVVTAPPPAPVPALTCDCTVWVENRRWVRVARVVDATHFYCTSGCYWVWDPVRCLWYDP